MADTSELRGLIFTVLGVFFLLTIFGTMFGQIFNNYGVQEQDKYNLTTYANKSATTDFVGGLREKLARNPLLTILTAPIDLIMYFFNLINIISAFVSSIGAALMLPPFIADYLLLYITVVIILGIFFIFFGRRL